jgi:8-oxo-dGTP diphosphatase
MTHLKTKVAQYGIIFKENKFLMLRLSKKADPSEAWIFPGGRLEHNEKPLDGLRREIKEESGLDVKIVFPCGIGMWDNRYAVFFVCKLNHKQKVKLSEEHQDFKWYSAKELDKIDFRDRSMKKAVKQAYKLLNHS